MTTTPTLTLTAFLEARIADCESTARDMQDQERLGRPFFDVDSLAGGTGIRELIDPARVLAECEAKRRIVERCAAILAHDDWEYSDTPTLAEATLSDLAAIWADHPDYREEWRP